MNILSSLTSLHNNSLSPAAFLDRDGVINVDHGYVHNLDNFHWVPGAKMAIKYLNDFGYMVFVVTNQAGVARGYYNESAVNQLHQWINAELASYGGHVDAFYYCPHHPKGLIPNYCRICECRKPAPGMLLRAFREWPITRTCSFLIGDKETDIAAASAANVPGYLFDGENLFVTVRRVIHITGHNKSCAPIHAKSLSGLLPGSTLKAVRGKTGQGQNG